MPLTDNEKIQLIDLRHREERNAQFKEHRKESNDLYADKQTEKITKWMVATTSTLVFIGLVGIVISKLVGILS